MKTRDSKGRFTNTEQEVEQLTKVKMNWKKLLIDIAKVLIGAIGGWLSNAGML